MPVISVNISDEADSKLVTAAKALGKSKSKMFEFILMNMDAVFGETVVARIKQIAELQKRAKALL